MSETKGHDHNEPQGPFRRRPPGWIAYTTAITLTVVALATLAGLTGYRNWFCDLLNNFRVQYVLILLTISSISLIVWRPKLFAISMILLIVNGWPVINYFIGPASDIVDGEKLTVMTFNVKSANTNYQRAIDWILENDPDIVAILEVNDEWARHLETLKSEYPHHRVEPRANNFGMALFSRLNLASIETFPPENQPSIKATVETDSGEFELVATHPIPPMNSTRFQKRNELLVEMAGQLDQSQPRILIGDFNMTPWSPWFQVICREGQIRDASKGFGVKNTWQVYPTILGGLKIDHVLLSEHFKCTQFEVSPFLGSDHRAVMCELTLSAN